MSIFGFSDDPIWPWAYEAPGSSALGKAAWKAAGSHFCWLIRPLATGGFEYAEVMARGESPMTAEGQHSGPLDELVERLRQKSDLTIFLYPVARDVARNALDPLTGHGGFLDVAGELQPLQRLSAGEPWESWQVEYEPGIARIVPGPAEMARPRRDARQTAWVAVAGFGGRVEAPFAFSTPTR